MSRSLGANCTFCHNSRAFSSWEQSTPQRVQAWYGIQMLKDVNTNFMTPLAYTFPDHRKGQGGDVAKANCATCHQGVNKPLYGKSMLQDYPFLAPNNGKPKEGNQVANNQQSNGQILVDAVGRQGFELKVS